MLKSKDTADFGIYRWTNLITGVVLIGQTGPSVGFEKRAKQHLAALRKNKHRNQYFQRSFNKHGEENFLAEVQEQLFDASALTAREQHWVDFYREQPGGVYNQVGPVDAPRRGAKASSETRQRLRDSHLGLPSPRKGSTMPEEWRSKHSERMKLVPISTETRRKQSEAIKGRPLTDEHKASIAAARIGFEFSVEARQKMSDSHKGHVPYNKGKKLSSEEKARRKEKRNATIARKKAEALVCAVPENQEQL